MQAAGENTSFILWHLGLTMSIHYVFMFNINSKERSSTALIISRWL